MKVIDSKTHGILDYMTALLLIASPWIFGFYEIEAAMWIPVAVGILVVVMSFMTKYELGISPVIPFTVHLTVDLVVGLFLMASPWVFDFGGEVIWPHVFLGLTTVTFSLITRHDVQDPELQD